MLASSSTRTVCSGSAVGDRSDRYVRIVRCKKESKQKVERKEQGEVKKVSVQIYGEVVCQKLC